MSYAQPALRIGILQIFVEAAQVENDRLRGWHAERWTEAKQRRNEIERSLRKRDRRRRKALAVPWQPERPKPFGTCGTCGKEFSSEVAIRTHWARGCP